MSKPKSNAPLLQPFVTTARTEKLDPVKVLSALGSEVRWPIVKLLADGRRMSTGEIAAAFQRDIDGIGHQLKIMREAGVVDAYFGEDRRHTIYEIPAARRPAPGVIDYGFCVVDLNKV